MIAPVIKCGHAAQAVDAEGDPCCVICAGTPESTVVDTSAPNLVGRFAQCGYCRTQMPSGASLAFFEYQGPGSKRASETCKHCGYFEVAHRPGGNSAVKGYRNPHVCNNFEPHGAFEFDSYYCGCRGWD